MPEGYKNQTTAGGSGRKAGLSKLLQRVMELGNPLPRLSEGWSSRWDTRGSGVHGGRPRQQKDPGSSSRGDLAFRHL